MSLSEIIQYVRRERKKLTLYNPDPEGTLATDLASQFQNQNVEVVVSVTSSGWPADIAVLERDGSILRSLSTTQLQTQLAGTATVDHEMAAPSRQLLEAVSEMTFPSADRAQLLAVSTEIEDRAMRTEPTTLYAGFQQPAHLEPRRDRYEALAATGLEVHTFAVPGDSEPVSVAGVTHHAIDSTAIRRHWFLAIDGEDEAKTVLLAEEYDPGLFDGFWSDDPEIVDRVVETLSSYI